jgi:hypothetical protein
VVATIGYAVVVGLAEVERPRTNQAGGAGARGQQNGEFVVDVAVSGVSGGCHVVGALPHLVERVDAERPTALNQTFELLGGRPSTSVFTSAA